MVDTRCPTSPSELLGLKPNMSKGLGFLRSSHHLAPVGHVFSGPLPRIRTYHDLNQSGEPLTSCIVSVLPRFVGFGTNIPCPGCGFGGMESSLIGFVICRPSSPFRGLDRTLLDEWVSHIPFSVRVCAFLGRPSSLLTI